MSVRTLNYVTDTSLNTGLRVKSPICIYIDRVSCQQAGILKLKGENDRMRHLALALVLACVLAGTARAGEIHPTGAVATPPPPTPLAITGEIPTTEETAPEESSTVLTIILTLIIYVR